MKINELIEELEKKELLTKHGLRIDGFGHFINQIDKIEKTLEKLQRNIYFMEERQKRIEDLLKEKL